MSVRRFDLAAGGDDFAFLAETEPKIDFWMSKYPESKQRSAVIPLLWLAQKDNGGWLSEPAMREVADRLQMPYIRVYEVATFYTMFNLKPVGRFHVQLCGTTPCMLRGANDLKEVCKSKIGPKESVTENGRLSWVEVECLGACVNAPMVQINDYYYEDLTPSSFEQILDCLENGIEAEPGTYVDRTTSAPIGEAKTLIDDALYNGSAANAITLPNLPETKPESDLKPASGATKAVPAPAPAPKVTPVKAEAAPAAKAEPSAPSGGAKFGAITSFAVGSSSDKGTEEAGDPTEDDKPTGLAGPEGGKADDLKIISGIGPVIEKKLHDLGIFHFHQIAVWTRREVAWVDGFLSFKGRIEREKWIAQAIELAK